MDRIPAGATPSSTNPLLDQCTQLLNACKTATVASNLQTLFDQHTICDSAINKTDAASNTALPECRQLLCEASTVLKDKSATIAIFAEVSRLKNEAFAAKGASDPEKLWQDLETVSQKVSLMGSKIGYDDRDALHATILDVLGKLVSINPERFESAILPGDQANRLKTDLAGRPAGAHLINPRKLSGTSLENYQAALEEKGFKRFVSLPYVRGGKLFALPAFILAQGAADPTWATALLSKLRAKDALQNDPAIALLEEALEKVQQNPEALQEVLDSDTLILKFVLLIRSYLAIAAEEQDAHFDPLPFGSEKLTPDDESRCMILADLIDPLLGVDFWTLNLTRTRNLEDTRPADCVLVTVNNQDRWVLALPSSPPGTSLAEELREAEGASSPERENPFLGITSTTRLESPVIDNEPNLGQKLPPKPAAPKKHSKPLILRVIFASLILIRNFWLHVWDWLRGQRGM